MTETKALACPKCKQTRIFDITRCDGCDGEVQELHCPECDHYFDPRTIIPEYQRCGHTNTVRHKHNRERVHELIEERIVHLGPDISDMEGCIEVSELTLEGKATGLRYHLRASRKKTEFDSGWNHGEHRS